MYNFFSINIKGAEMIFDSPTELIRFLTAWVEDENVSFHYSLKCTDEDYASRRFENIPIRDVVEIPTLLVQHYIVHCSDGSMLRFGYKIINPSYEYKKSMSE